MNKKRKNISAFTLLEMMVIFIIMGIIAAAVAKIAKTRTDYTNQYMYYAAYTAIKDGMSELIAIGCLSSDLEVCGTTKSLPLKGHVADNTGFCDRISDLYNTVGTVNCDTSTDIPPGTTDFSSKTPNFVTTNNLRFYNMAADPIPMSYDPSSGAGDEISLQTYVFYVDIDGPKRHSILNQDVVRFYVLQDDAKLMFDPTSVGSTNLAYLSASVRYKDSSRVYHWLDRGVSLQRAMCISGSVPYINFCDNFGITRDTTNCPASGSTCEVIINKPGYYIR